MYCGRRSSRRKRSGFRCKCSAYSFYKIIDVTGDTPVELKGRVPARSVVIPGSYTKQFPAGEFQVPCALIIGKRKESTDKKTSLNDALRENNVAV